MAKEQLTLDTMLKAYMKWFSKYHMDEGNIRRIYETYKTKQPKASVNDFLWYIFNTMPAESAKQVTDLKKFYNIQMDIGTQMWMFVKKYEGRTGNHILQTIEQTRIEQYKLFPYKTNIKVSASHCCPFCDALNGKIYTIEEYLEEEPIGSENCTRVYGCNCRTVPVPQRDADGRLIKNKDVL